MPDDIDFLRVIAKDHELLAEENEVLKDRLILLRAVAEAAEKLCADPWGHDIFAARDELRRRITAAKEAGAL